MSTSTSPVPPKRDILGIGITRATPVEIAGVARTLIADRREPATIASVNVHTFVEAQRDPGYRAALSGATITWVDGVPIRWFLKAGGDPVPPPRIHGHDFMNLLMKELPDARHYFYGSTTETLSLLESALKSRYPGIRISGMVSPPFRKRAQREDAETIERINRSGADILWVGLGAPKQEMWLHLNGDRLTIPVSIAIGAAFDIQAGRYTRAPVFWQKLGLEWAWRLMQDPARLWRRYFSTNGYFLSLLLREASRRLFRPAPRGSSAVGS